MANKLLKLGVGAALEKAGLPSGLVNLANPKAMIAEGLISAAKEVAQHPGVPQSEMPVGMRGEGFAKGGKVASASKRADGCAQRGKTRGRMV